jgi:hypothetical protein
VKKIIAVDPGASGGIAWTDGGGNPHCVPMPETVGVKALASATGSEVPTPRTDELLMLLKLTPEYTKQKCTDANRALYLCRKLEHELAAMTATAKQLEGGCHMAIGYIAGSTPDPEKSGTYRYLKSVTSAGLPNSVSATASRILK